MDLGKSINIALEGAAIFKVFSFYECSDPGKQCCYIFKTYWRKIFTEALNIVFICKSNVDTLKLVVQVIEQLRGDSVHSKHGFYP